MNIYVTFGQVHAHRVNGKTLDCDCVAILKSESVDAGRAMAFELFGPKFSFVYSEEDWDHSDMQFYPNGYVHI